MQSVKPTSWAINPPAIHTKPLWQLRVNWYLGNESRIVAEHLVNKQDGIPSNSTIEITVSTSNSRLLPNYFGSD